MTTISERLRDPRKRAPMDAQRDTMREAADTIDALVAALEGALPYVGRYESENMSNVALAVMQKADAALALARKGGCDEV